ncbi:LysR family transcriptional regulator [Acinetobacter sp. NCu2D-2]|uniref:LysR family transcriptional regulator n=1 Tax=Acinetobacter sp. NCu2D-2 TaxID=1608473 RepID=UPI0007CDB450|nr:LysR family transcriptional regulator [Acinetobacter sp. NCu2D-2]ANF81505.1 LysR family transcriptional regulator [Acinetobacter sp. NCu2D-2]
MLDQLRAMGVFACVVEKNSFSGAARELGITTSAVSQQIRSLEQDMEVILLNRSTRKLSLTEAGQAFFYSCQEMLSAAERGKVRINELRDDLVGELRIASTAELCAAHVVPALSHWMSAHRGLNIHFETDDQETSLVDGRIDIALRLGQNLEDQHHTVIPLIQIEQILVAAPSYINQSALISQPDDLKQHDLLIASAQKTQARIEVQHVNTAEKVSMEIQSRFNVSSELIAKAMCLQGNGISKSAYLDVQKDLKNGALVEVLPEWKLAPVTLYAVIPKSDQQPTKILRCLDTLKQYFSQINGGRIFHIAS